MFIEILTYRQTFILSVKPDSSEAFHCSRLAPNYTRDLCTNTPSLYMMTGKVRL